MIKPIIITIIISIWTTSSIIYCVKEYASPYRRMYPWFLWILDIFFAPVFIFQDLVDEWREWKKIMKE